MRTLLLIIALLFVLVLFWSRPQRGNGGPRYGSVPIYPDTPYSSIYVGLEADDEQALYDVIAKYGETNGIQRCKSYIAYSGPPLATYTGDHIAIFVRSYLTPSCMKEHERAQNMVGLSDFYHWPTNGSRVIINGHRMQMPFTGIIWIEAYDTNYSNREFREDSEGLAAALRSAFTNRSVDLFMPDEIKP
jgi:hypothetical protein